MFIVSLTYKVPLTEIEPHFNAHMEYVAKHYQTGNFLASGRKEPRTGGVILAKAESLSKMQAIVNADPFIQAEVADAEITEMLVSNTAEELNFLQAI